MDHRPYSRSTPNANTGILLIHGILSTPRHFDFLIRHIPNEYAVSNILLAGHGGSVKDFSKASMAQWQQQVEQQILKMSQTCGNIILIGHSLGSLLALQAACKFDCIRGLFLLNPPLLPRVQASMMGRSIRFAFGKLRPDDIGDVLCHKDLSIQLEPYLWKYLGWIPNFISLLQLSAKCRKIPAALDIPCYAFIGMQDELVNPKTAKYFPENPNISLEILENGVHFGYFPEEQSRIIAGFLQFLLGI